MIENDEITYVISINDISKGDITRLRDEIGNSTIYDIHPYGILIKVDTFKRCQIFSADFKNLYREAQINNYQWIRVT